MASVRAAFEFPFRFFKLCICNSTAPCDVPRLLSAGEGGRPPRTPLSGNSENCMPVSLAHFNGKGMTSRSLSGRTHPVLRADPDRELWGNREHALAAVSHDRLQGAEPSQGDGQGVWRVRLLCVEAASIWRSYPFGFAEGSLNSRGSGRPRADSARISVRLLASGRARQIPDRASAVLWRVLLLRQPRIDGERKKATGGTQGIREAATIGRVSER